MNAVPWYFQLFLVMVIVISSIVLSKQYNLKPKSKNLVLLFDLFLYFVFGVSLSCAIFNGSMAWWSILCHVFIGVLCSFIFAVFLNRGKDIFIESGEYTPENLIGKKGIIIDPISGSFSNGFVCLGKLQDDYNTNIKLYILPVDIINKGDVFEIIEIDKDKVIGKIIESKYEIK